METQVPVKIQLCIFHPQILHKFEVGKTDFHQILMKTRVSSFQNMVKVYSKYTRKSNKACSKLPLKALDGIQ